MKIIETAFQKDLGEMPTRLEVLREINKRGGLDNHRDLKGEWRRLEKGFAGEQLLLDYIEKFGESDWSVLRNIWLEYYGEFECDLLLATYTGLYGFEVKNYSRPIEIVNNEVWMLGEVMGKNPISQARNMASNLNKIFKHNSELPKVQGVLTLIGEDNGVKNHESVTDVKVLARGDIREYIWRIVQNERNYPGYPINPELILKKLARFETKSSFVQEELPGVIEKNIRKGICCSHCGSFDLETNGNYIVCPCGVHESREEAIVRTICEYGIIYNDRNFTTRELMDFLKGIVSLSTLQRYLNKHFKKIGSYRNTEYINEALLFEINRKNFNLRLPRYLKY
jgi:hypothetical protein